MATIAVLSLGKFYLHLGCFHYFSYPLVMTNIAMAVMALIEIDGLPFLIAW
jgi:hypothetical protein